MGFYANRERDGMTKIIQFGKLLCRLVSQFRVIIEQKYPSSVPIGSLLTAIDALCVVILQAEADYLEASLNQSEPPAEFGDTGGIDPNAPLPLPPDWAG